jgi:hypothetical protein
MLLVVSAPVGSRNAARKRSQCRCPCNRGWNHAHSVRADVVQREFARRRGVWYRFIWALIAHTRVRCCIIAQEEGAMHALEHANVISPTDIYISTARQPTLLWL